MTTKNICQLTFFLWLRRDVDEQKLISDDKNYDEIYAASSLTRQDGTKMLFEYTWGTFYPGVHQTHLECLLLKS